MKPIRLVLSMPFEKLPEEASRFWGNPALPEGVAYPMYLDDDGEECPYVFICQINMADVAPYDTENALPHSGLMLFFAKIDHYLGYFDYTECIGGHISDPDDVKVMYFPDPQDLREVVLLDEDEKPFSPEEMQITFSLDFPKYCADHALLAEPTHREWATWDAPYEDWQILLQIDSFAGKDFDLNFMDCGVLDFLISPAALKARDFSDVRGIVLST